MEAQNQAVEIKRRPWVAFAVVALAVSTVACGTDVGTSPTDAGSPTSPTTAEPGTSEPDGAGDIRRFEGETLTIAGYSSTFNDVWNEAFGAYFTERTGVNLEWLESSPSQAIARIQAAGGSPDIDMMLADSANLAHAIEAGVLGEVDQSNIPHYADVPDNLRIDYGIPTMLYRYGHCYNTERFDELGLGTPNTPETWFSEDLAGHTMLPSTTAAQWLISVPALATTLGFGFEEADATADRLAELQPYGLFNASGDVDAAMTAGDVWLTLGNNQGRCLALRDQDVPVEYANWTIEADGQEYSDLINPDNMVMAQGTEKQEIVELFMNEYLSAEAASATLPLWQFIRGTPPTEAQVEEVAAEDPTTEEWLITDPTALYLPDYLEFLPHLEEWTDAWSGVLQ